MSKTKNNGADEPSATNAKQSDLADLVLAPGGPRPRSRLHRVPPHHVIRYRMGTVHIVDLSTGDDVARIDPPDRNIAGPLGNGWIVFAKYVNDTGSPITAFTTRWTVPEPPRTNSGQTSTFLTLCWTRENGRSSNLSCNGASPTLAAVRSGRSQIGMSHQPATSSIPTLFPFDHTTRSSAPFP